MKQVFTILFTLVVVVGLNAQSASITGTLKDGDSNPVEFVNVVLYNAADSSMVKVETTDQTGTFKIQSLNGSDYWIEASYVGLENLREVLIVEDGMDLDLGDLIMDASSVELEEAVITAQRSIVEIKTDRTVFNVEGTINSTGDDALNLLRKAPGVLIDNNDNITVLSRSGVLVYIDGKRLPLSGDDLANYLKAIPAEQIDRIDIITNPGAKYEAEGTAGIIDIRMKRDKGLGSNGTVTSTYSQGQYARGNVNALGNYRNKKLNAFAQVGYNDATSFNDMNFSSIQNDFTTEDEIRSVNRNSGYNYRLGTDFFIGKDHTLGFLISGNNTNLDGTSYNRVEIGRFGESGIDSILVANNTSDAKNLASTYNLNYVFNNKKTTINVDADYGRYRNNNDYYQPNTYYDPNEEVILTVRNTTYNTENNIDILTFLIDVETELWGGKIGFGTKFSKVGTDNTFLFYDIPDEDPVFNDSLSNIFLYDEYVYAGYFNYARSIGKKWNFSAGLRLEQTDATGDLQTFDPDLSEPPVKSNYLSAFPSAGLTYNLAPEHSFSLNYGRRINRPDYNVLNPFRVQLSELSYRKGNPFLKPEIVNNMELGYTLKYMYNFKVSYSNTIDKITRLISPDKGNPLAGFLTWDNLATQTVFALNISAPVEITKKWNAFFNISGSHINNQADYGDEGTVDIKVWNYSIYQQHTFKLPWKFTAEVSGWFSGPGVWGGVFLYDETWSLNLGLQRRFFKEKMNVRLTFNDIFYKTGWSGTSEFNGLVTSGNGAWDSRRGSLSISYNFGNNNVKSRKRETGLEQEAKRVKSE
jgi:iron complex outermembrane recepter protein